MKNPKTGRRVARLNPESAWIIQEMPELRIVDEALWATVQARLTATRQSPGVVKASLPSRCVRGTAAPGPRWRHGFASRSRIFHRLLRASEALFRFRPFGHDAVAQREKKALIMARRIDRLRLIIGASVRLHHQGPVVAGLQVRHPSRAAANRPVVAPTRWSATLQTATSATSRSTGASGSCIRASWRRSSRRCSA